MAERIWLEIQRTTGVDVRKITAERSSPVGVAEGACPGCGTTPFLVQGSGITIHSNDIGKAAGRAKCCGDPVGYIYVKVETLFGLEEDFAMLVHGRARVYG